MPSNTSERAVLLLEIDSKGAVVSARSLNSELGELDKRGDQAAKSTVRMGAAAKSASGGLGDMSRSAGAATATVAQFLTGLGAGLLTFEALRRGIVATISTYADFSKSISELSAITGASGRDLDYLGESSLQMGIRVGRAGEDVVEAFKLVASAKPDLLANIPALKATTEAVLELAAAAQIDLALASETVGGSLNAYGLAASEATRVTNVLAAGSKLGASEVRDTAVALEKFASTAASMGVSIESSAAAIQILALNSQKGEIAGTALRAMLLRLEASADRNLRPSIVGLTGAFANLADKQLGAIELSDLFGEGVVTHADILQKNAAALGRMEQGLTDTSIASKQAVTNLDNLSGAWTRLTSAGKAYLTDVGESAFGWLKDPIGEAADALERGRFLNQFDDLSQQIRNLERSLDITAVIGDSAQSIDEVYSSLDRMGAKLSDIEALNASLETMVRTMESYKQEADGVERSTADFIEGMDRQTYASGKLKEKMEENLAAFIARGEAEKRAKDPTSAYSLEIEKQIDVIKRRIELTQKDASLIDERLAYEEKSADLTEVQRQEAEKLLDQMGALQEKLKIVTQSKADDARETERHQQAVDGYVASLKEQILTVKTTLANRDQMAAKTEAMVALETSLAGAADAERAEIIRLAEALDSANSKLDRFRDGHRESQTEVQKLTAHYQGLSNELRLTEAQAELAAYQLALAAAAASGDIGGAALLKQARDEWLALRSAMDSAPVQAVTDDFERLGDTLQDRLVPLTDSLAQGFASLFQSADFSISGIMDALSGPVLGQAYSNFAAGLQGLFQGDASFFQGPQNQYWDLGGGNFGPQTPQQSAQSQAAYSTQVNQAIAQGAISGALAGYQAAQSQGYGTQNAQLQGVVGGAAAGASSGGGWIGAIVGAIVGGQQSGLFSGSDWQEVGREISVRITDGAIDWINGQSIQQRYRSMFGGTAETSQYFPLDGFGGWMEAFGVTMQTLLDQSASAGLAGAPEALSGFQGRFDIDITGMDEAQINQAVIREFQRLADQLAQDILGPTLWVIKDAGETAAEVLADLALITPIIEDALGQLGVRIEDLIPVDFFDVLAEDLVSGRFNLAGDRTGQVVPQIDTQYGGQGVVASLTGAAVTEAPGVFEIDPVAQAEAARIIYIDMLADAAGGAERFAEMIGNYASAFLDSNDLAARAIQSAIDDQQSIVDSQLSAIGTTRETFAQDLEAALAGTLTPEALASWIAAGESLSTLMSIERDRAILLGEVVDVTSLTADQFALLQTNMTTLVDGLDRLNIQFDITAQQALEIESVFGSLGQFGASVANFFQEFGAEIPSSLDLASQTLAEFGLTAGDLADQGGQVVADMLQAAIDAGDYDRAYAIISQLGPATRLWLDELESQRQAQLQAAQATAAQVRALADFNEGMRDLGLASDATAGQFEALVTLLGSSSEVSAGWQFVFDNFLSDADQSALSFAAAGAAIEAAGFSVSQFADMTHEQFVQLLQFARDTGNTTLEAALLDVAPAVLTIIGPLDQVENAFQDAASTLQQVAEAVAQVRGNIQSSIRSILGTGLPGQGPSGGLTGRISDLYGQLDAGGLSPLVEIDLINQIQGLVTERYQNEHEQIMANAQAAANAINEGYQLNNELSQLEYQRKLDAFNAELQRYNQLSALASQIGDYIRGFDLNAYSNLDYQTQLQIAQGQFSQQVQSVLSGEGDGSGLTQLADQILGLGQNVYASSPAYQQLREQILAALGQVEAFAAGVAEPDKPIAPIIEDISVTAQSIVGVNQQILNAQHTAVAELDALQARLLQIQEEQEAAAEAERQAEIQFREDLVDGTTDGNAKTDELIVIGNQQVQTLALSIEWLERLDLVGTKSVGRLDSISSDLRAILAAQSLGGSEQPIVDAVNNSAAVISSTVADGNGAIVFVLQSLGEQMASLLESLASQGPATPTEPTPDVTTTGRVVTLTKAGF